MGDCQGFCGQSVLQEWCKDLQQTLGLQDWLITLHEGMPADEMSNKDDFGYVEINETCKRADIYVRDPKTVLCRYRPVFDPLQTVAHEMMHIKLCLLDDYNPLQDRLLHQYIDDIAKAFCMIARKYSKGVADGSKD